EMLKQARFLENIAERTLVGRQERAIAVLPDLAVDFADAIHVQETGDAAQDRGLAAPRWAEQGGHSLGRRGKAGVERELADRAAKFSPDRVCRVHAPARAKRFSSRIIVRMTPNANTTMPPARKLASRQRMVSTKSKIAVDMTRVRPGTL